MICDGIDEVDGVCYVVWYIDDIVYLDIFFVGGIFKVVGGKWGWYDVGVFVG